MATDRRTVCVLILLLFTWEGRPANAGVTVSPAAEISYSQPSGTASDPAVRLKRATFRVTPTELDFTIATEADADPGLFHIYLDTDLDASTGYQPPSRKPGDLGADYLVEGSTLHIWDGGANHAAWSWKATGTVSVSRSPQGELQVSVPRSKLSLKDSAHLRILVETLTEKWESADTLPRQGIWDTSQSRSDGADSNSSPSTGPRSDASAKTAEVGYVEQTGQPSARKSASLVRASVSFLGDTLLATVTTEADPDPAKYHVYIDTDMNISTGFHPATAATGLGGADFLCEGGFLYAWDGGDNQSAWSWRKIAPVTVTRGAERQLQIAIPLAPLNLQGRKQMQLLVETIDDNWKTEDVIPRDHSWLVKLPDGP